jgi:uncharacterized protein YdbL (DUF1318 family)
MAVGATCLSLLFFTVSAWALGLGEAKSRGLVGETPGGYLRAVSSPSAEVKQLVSRINAERRKVYQGIAKKRGTSLKNVEALAGKKAIDKSAPGEYVFVGGSWRKK